MLEAIKMVFTFVFLSNIAQVSTFSTLKLTTSVNKLMNSRALVRKLSSIEQLGCIDTLVVEKTGVLTENKLSVVNFVTNTAQDARDPDTGKVINFFKNFNESNKALLATIAACWLK